MRARHLFAAVLAGLALNVIAATVPYKFNGMNVTREGGVTYLRGTSPSEVAAAGVSVSNHTISAAGAANWYVGTGALVQTGGVVFNAAVPVAATAASVALAAVRANPAGLITSAVASYLLSKGIEYVNGSFNTTVVQGSTSPVWVYTYGNPPRSFNTGSALCAYINTQNADYHHYVWATSASYPNGYCKATKNYPFDGWGQAASQVSRCWVPDGELVAWPVNGVCQVVTTQEPVSESTWDAARTGYWPDAATYDLVKAGVPLPTDKAVFSPPYADVPLADPVLDPVTGKRMQEVARVTPSPTAPDTADVSITKREVDSDGNPVVDPVTGSPVPATEEKDLCKLNPGASGCKPLDDVPDMALPENTITLSINPVSGFGPETGTCPADRTLFSKGGAPIVWSWGQYCTFASGIRPLIVGFAWLAALMIVIGVARRNS